MFEKIVEEIKRAQKPELLEVAGRAFVTAPVFLPPPIRRLAIPLQVHTLSAVVEKTGTLPVLEAANALAVIESPAHVGLYGMLDSDRQREVLLQAVAITSSFQFGSWYNIEDFLIALQTQFEVTEHQTELLSILGNLSDESLVSYLDDGVTQKVTMVTGVARLGNAALPRIVTLRPYRTFADVDQPQGTFLVRLRRVMGKAPEAALFSADGGLWARTAMSSIKTYLKENISNQTVTVIG